MGRTEPFLMIQALFERARKGLSNKACIIKNGSVQPIIRRLNGKGPYKKVSRWGPGTDNNVSINSTQLMLIGRPRPVVCCGAATRKKRSIMHRKMQSGFVFKRWIRVDLYLSRFGVRRLDMYMPCQRWLNCYTPYPKYNVVWKQKCLGRRIMSTGITK